MENLQFSLSGIHPTWVAHNVVRTIKTDQPLVTKRELKDNRQLFPFLLRPGEEMGLAGAEGFRVAYERISGSR